MQIQKNFYLNKNLIVFSFHVILKIDNQFSDINTFFLVISIHRISNI